MVEQAASGGKKRNRNKKKGNKNKNQGVSDGAEGGVTAPVQVTPPASEPATPVEPKPFHGDTMPGQVKSQPKKEDPSERLLKNLLMEINANHYMTSMAQLLDAERAYYTNIKRQVRTESTRIFELTILEFLNYPSFFKSSLNNTLENPRFCV